MAGEESERETGPERPRVAELEVGARIEGVFLLSKLDLRTTQKGAHYFTCMLGDRTGSVEGRQWDCDPDTFAELRQAGVVAITALVDEWRGATQLKIHSMRPTEAGPEQLRELVARTPFDVEELFSELLETLRTLDSPWLREMFEVAFADADFVARLKESPAASSYHHSYLGGLLEHIVSLLRVSEQLLRAYPRLNRDLVLAGAVLHDIGKVEELAWDKGFRYTTRGQLLGHIAIGTLYIERWTRDIADFPAELRDELTHLVLSHHGLREHGSPVLPATPEAIVVHFLDNLDGRLWSAWRAIDDPAGDDEWSPWSRHLGQKIFRRDRVEERPKDALGGARHPSADVGDGRADAGSSNREAAGARTSFGPLPRVGSSFDSDALARARGPRPASGAPTLRSRDESPPLFG